MRWRDEGAAAAAARRRVLVRAAALWLPAAVTATVLAGIGYGLTQQVLRSGANDPQIQIAHSAAERLSSGATPSDVAAGPPVDLASSLDVTVGVFDRQGQALASTALLDNAVPRLPTGALTAARSSGQDLVTWQPRPGVRQAAVIVPFAGPRSNGYVVAARSLRLIEQREDQALAIAVLGLIVTLVCAAGAALVASHLWLAVSNPGVSSAAESARPT